jgi:nicotinate-nucleotide adenylyltransferase
LKRRRIGVFGGTFDPVHFGHLILAQEAVTQLGLARVLFVPAARAPHKRGRRLAPVEHRLAMLRLAARGNPSFSVSRIEAERGGISFTAVTLELLARAERAEIYFLMGQDSLEEFHTWREPERIARLAKLAVLPRGDREPPRVAPPLRPRVVLLRSPRIGISSTEIRRRLRRSLPVRYWVPDPVLAYAARHGLYGIHRSR